jgi:hypothetical protein
LLTLAHGPQADPRAAARKRCSYRSTRNFPLPAAREVVRAPDDVAVEVPLAAPMIESAGTAVERVEPVERLSFNQVSALMRHRVEGRDGAPLGSGGGRRRT